MLPIWWNAQSFTVDPHRPCRYYDLASARQAPPNDPGNASPQQVYRGAGSQTGVTWQRAFIAPPSNINANGAALDVSASGSPWLATDPNRMFSSMDAGSTWIERDSGRVVPDPALGQSFTTLMLAPSDASTGYVLQGAAGGSDQAPLLSVTRDGGDSWKLETVPPGLSGSGRIPVGIDPLDALHLFLTTYSASLSTLWESHDAGSTWTPASLPSIGPIDQLVVGHARGQVATLYASSAGTWFTSGDGGASWVALPLPTTNESTGFTRLAVDATEPGTAVWANGQFDAKAGGISRVNIVGTTDGFQPNGLNRYTLNTSAGASFVGWDSSLQADMSGDFFLGLHTFVPVPSAPYYAANSGQVIAFRPSALAGASQTIPAAPAPPSQPGINLPGEGPPIQPTSTCTNSAGNGGSLAFDGRYLDYTDDAASPGVIFRMDTACRSVQALAVTFPGLPTGTPPPPLFSLTWDPLFRWLPSGRQGALLASGPEGADPSVPSTYSPIYAIDPVLGVAQLVTSTDLETGGCTANNVINGVCADSSFFSFDVFRSGLWSWGEPQGNGPQAGFLTLDGVFHDTCITHWDDDGAALNVAAGVVGGDGILYIASEDDTTIYRMDAQNCDILGGFSHMNIGENQAEDEQIACDPLTFATPVIWIRNSTGSTVAAYPAPEASCPFPTKLEYHASPAASPGSPIRLCFTLTANLAGQWGPLADQSIAVAVGGKNIGATTPTDPSGNACLETTAPAKSGPAVIEGAFHGTHAYLPSVVDGTLLVFAIVTPSGQNSGGLALPPAVAQPPAPQPGEVPAGQGVPEVQAQLQTQAEAQAQSQSQAQTQSVTQLQPGLMTQERRRTQVATEGLRNNDQAAYQAVAMRTPPAPAFAVVAGLTLLGVGVLARRPRVAWARKSRGMGGR